MVSKQSTEAQLLRVGQINFRRIVHLYVLGLCLSCKMIQKENTHILINEERTLKMV